MAHDACRPGAQTGMSLLELSLVMIIVSLLLGGLMLPLSTRHDQARRQQTQHQLELIMEAVTGFALGTGRLPCPDTDQPPDGREDRQGDRCRDDAGFLPWRSLGVTAHDAWGHPLRYLVSHHFADAIAAATVSPPTSCRDSPVQASFAFCSSGDLVIREGRGGPVLAEGIPLVVLSTGSNGVITGGADEAENLDGDRELVYRDGGVSGANRYDDLMVWLSPQLLAARMLAAGRLP